MTIDHGGRARVPVLRVAGDHSAPAPAQIAFMRNLSTLEVAVGASGYPGAVYVYKNTPRGCDRFLVNAGGTPIEYDHFGSTEAA